MIPSQFDYVAATSVEDAVQFLAAHPGARVVAGGTDLIPALFHRRVAPSALLDITSLSALSEVERLPSGGMRLGALVTLDALAADSEVAQAYPALAEALAVIADPQVRNRATVGGNLAQTGSGGDLAAVLIALDAAVLVTTAGGPQRIAVAALVSAPPDPATIITAVELPAPAPGSAYEKFRHPASGYAICGVAAFVNVQPDGTLGTCRLAVTGATTVTQHLSLLEAAMAGMTATAVDLPAKALQEQLASMSFVDDRAGSADYRAHLTAVLAEESVSGPLLGQQQRPCIESRNRVGVASTMKNVPDTALGRMYRQHIQLILDKNIEALLDQYTDDALLISSFMKTPQYYKGRDQIREHMQGILGIQGLESDIAFWAETDDPQTLMIVEEITMHTAEGDAHMRFADSWVLQGGRIAIHFAGMTQYPDGSVA